MQISTMRRVDRLLGVPVCFFLTIIRNVLERGRVRQPAEPRRIIFVKLAEQGSTVLACQALQHAGELVGRENLYFLAFEENRFILDAMDLVPEQNIITIDQKSLFSVVFSACRAIRAMRRKKVQIAIDMEFFARSSAALCFLSGAKWRVGFHAFFGEASYRGDLVTHRMLFNSRLHTSQTFVSLVQALEVDPGLLPTSPRPVPDLNEEPPPFRPEETELEQVTALIRRETSRDRVPPLLLFNANCSDLLLLRRWPSGRYVELGRRILAKYPELYVGFTGAPSEAAAADGLVRQIGSERCLSFAGKTTLRELLVLYCASRMLVTNDSGPAHFAALTPIDVVVLFGPESPDLFAARTPRNHVLWAGIVCSPCINAFNDRCSPCTDNLCMQAITTDQVFEKVCALYEDQARRRVGSS